MRPGKRVLTKCLVAVLTQLVGAALFSGPLWGSTPANAEAARSNSRPKIQAVEDYGRLPLFFTENQGQVDPRVKFYARGQGQAFFFTPIGMVLSLRRATDQAVPGQSQGSRLVVQVLPQGMRSGVEILGIEPLPGKAHFFQGNDPGKWRTDVPTYKSVLYREAYPGIDLKFYGVGQQVEYDLVIKPGADPKRVKFLYQGIKALKVTKEGDLTISLPGGGELIQQKPVIYQEIEGRRLSREGRFRLLPGTGKRGYGFELASYDARYPLIIDPVVLVYSTYLGGSTWESGNGVAVDQSGSAYIVGTTQSTNFPTVNAYQGTYGGDPYDAFVAKFNSAGTALVYATYLGGSDYDSGLCIAVDGAGNAYVAGGTSSGNFPVTPGAYQTTLKAAGATNAFVTKLNPSGTVGYSTYLGGSKSDLADGGIALDNQGNIYVSGDTHSTDFPVTTGAFQGAFGGGTATYIFTVSGITTKPIAGTTYKDVTPTTYTVVRTSLTGTVGNISGTITVSGEPSPTPANGGAGTLTIVSGTGDNSVNYSGWVTVINVFVSKINPAASGAASLVYSTYLGGNASDSPWGIAVDANNSAYVAGQTTSSDFPKTDQSSLLGTMNAFVTKLKADGTGLLFSRYLGGTGSDAVTGGIALDAAGNIYIAGNTTSTNFPTMTPFQSNLGGTVNAFITKFNSSGTIIYSSYLGGNGTDKTWSLAVDSQGRVYLTGETTSSNFPVAGAFQKTLNGTQDAFVSEINVQGTGLIFSTYLGGSGQDVGQGVKLDATGRVYVTGITASTDFPTRLPYKAGLTGGTAAAFVTKLSLTAMPPVYQLLLLGD